MAVNVSDRADAICDERDVRDNAWQRIRSGQSPTRLRRITKQNVIVCRSTRAPALLFLDVHRRCGHFYSTNCPSENLRLYAVIGGGTCRVKSSREKKQNPCM